MPSFKIHVIIIFCVYVFFFFACMYVQYICVWDPWRLEEGSGPLEIELQMVVSYQVDAGH